MERIIQSHGLLTIVHWILCVFCIGNYFMSPGADGERALNPALIFILIPAVLSALICTFALFQNWKYHLKVGVAAAIIIVGLYWASLYFTSPSMNVNEKIEFQKYLMFMPWLYTLILFASVFIIGFFIPKVSRN